MAEHRGEQKKWTRRRGFFIRSLRSRGMLRASRGFCGTTDSDQEAGSQLAHATLFRINSYYRTTATVQPTARYGTCFDSTVQNALELLYSTVQYQPVTGYCTKFAPGLIGRRVSYISQSVTVLTVHPSILYTQSRVRTPKGSCSKLLLFDRHAMHTVHTRYTHTLHATVVQYLR